MSRKSISEKVAAMESRIENTQKKIADAKSAKKAQLKKLNRLKKDEHTHHLCVRAEALNSLLKRPDDLEDEQVIAFLNDIFKLSSVQKRLDAILPEDTVSESLENTAEEAAESEGAAPVAETESVESVTDKETNAENTAPNAEEEAENMTA